MSLKQQWSLLQGPIVICNSNFSPHFTGTWNGAQPGKGTLSSWYEAGRVGGSSYISASVCICTNLQSISLVKLFWSDRFISKIVYLISFNHLLFKLIHMFRCCFLRWNPIYCGKIINQETLSTFLGWMHLPRGQGKSTSSNTDLYHLARAWPTGGIHLYHYMNDVTDTWIKTARKTYFSSIRAGFLVGKIKLYTQIKMCMQRNRGIKLPGVFQNRQRLWCKQTSAPGRRSHWEPPCRILWEAAELSPLLSPSESLLERHPKGSRGNVGWFRERECCGSSHPSPGGLGGGALAQSSSLRRKAPREPLLYLEGICKKGRWLSVP